VEERAVANFRRLGPRVGGLMPALKQAIAAAEPAAMRKAFAAQGHYDIDVDNTVVELRPEDVEFHASTHEQLALARDGSYAVGLDPPPDGELGAEGWARELVRALNALPRTYGLELADRILVPLHATGDVGRAIEDRRDWIAGEVLALALTPLDRPPADVTTFT